MSQGGLVTLYDPKTLPSDLDAPLSIHTPPFFCCFRPSVQQASWLIPIASSASGSGSLSFDLLFSSSRSHITHLPRTLLLALVSKRISRHRPSVPPSDIMDRSFGPYLSPRALGVMFLPLCPDQRPPLDRMVYLGVRSTPPRIFSGSPSCVP